MNIIDAVKGLVCDKVFMRREAWLEKDLAVGRHGFSQIARLYEFTSFNWLGHPKWIEKYCPNEEDLIADDWILVRKGW